MGDRRRSPPRKHFKGRMAFSHFFVVACVTLATSQVYGKTTDPTMTDQPSTDPTTTDPPTTPHCECINPFTETKPDKAHRGDPDTLCGPKGPGFATSTATLTVATSSPLPVLQGASLP